MENHRPAWKWVTADEILCKTVCELLYALFIPSSSATATATIYNGENTNDEVIVAFRTAQSRQAVLKPPKPIYCPKGIFVDDIANVNGVLVQWRVIGD